VPEPFAWAKGFDTSTTSRVTRAGSRFGRTPRTLATSCGASGRSDLHEDPELMWSDSSSVPDTGEGDRTREQRAFVKAL